ncbi:MAG: thioredoxin domain-containing protein [Porphyrobacter sp.]|nr:thioredoxin domain-containing protein [Porphyrobacter sp.]
MTLLRSLAFTALAAPLALALGACGSKDNGTTGAAPTGGPVAPVAAPAGKMWTDVVSATPEGGMRMGNPNAPIKVVEYGALSCPHCARLANEGMKTIEDKYVNSGRVSYEFRSYIIHGAIDVMLTQMVRCADPSAFFPLVEQLYATQDQWIAQAEKANAAAQAAQSLPPAQRMAAMADAYGLTDWFAARGVSKDQSHACLANTDDATKIAAQTQKWYNDEGINQTPTIYINGNKTDIAEWKALEPALQNAGAR